LYSNPGSLLRRNLRERGAPGVLLTLRGHVYDEACKPVARAMLDFFHCDSKGKYDRNEVRYHGHQYTGPDGAYLLRTIVPNHYLRRTPHIHVKVQSQGGPVLDTQLFFPGRLRAYALNVAALNANDPAFKPALTVELGRRRRNQYDARFDFVIAL
jgi:protocatechuate 3,4-dioxygenase beta subunit